jgi:hypothetical protein
MVQYIRCCCSIGKAIVIDQMFVVLVVNNISVKIIVFLTINEGFVIEFSGLKDNFLLNVGGLLALMGILPLSVPSFPSVSRIRAFSRLVLLVYLFKATCRLIMPKCVTVGALPLKVCAVIHEVTGFLA